MNIKEYQEKSIHNVKQSILSFLRKTGDFSHIAQDIEWGDFQPQIEYEHSWDNDVWMWYDSDGRFYKFNICIVIDAEEQEINIFYEHDNLIEFNEVNFWKVLYYNLM